MYPVTSSRLAARDKFKFSSKFAIIRDSYEDHILLHKLRYIDTDWICVHMYTIHVSVSPHEFTGHPLLWAVTNGSTVNITGGMAREEWWWWREGRIITTAVQTDSRPATQNALQWHAAGYADLRHVCTENQGSRVLDHLARRGRGRGPRWWKGERKIWTAIITNNLKGSLNINRSHNYTDEQNNKP